MQKPQQAQGFVAAFYYTYLPGIFIFAFMNRKLSTSYFIASLLLSLLFTATLQAQEDAGATANLYDRGEKGDTLTVFADTAYIRDKPARNAQKVHLVTAGTKLVLLNNEANQKISGFDAAWAYVRFFRNGVAAEGYIWRGLLALGSYQRNNQYFMYSLDHAIPDKDKDMPSTYYAKIKVLDAALQPLAAKTWQLTSSDALSFTEGKLLGNMGLEGITSILRINFSGEACGIPDDYYYWGWTGTSFLLLPGKTNLSDAGVFYHSETLLFPTEPGGQAGKIVKQIEDGEVLEGLDKQGKERMKVTRSRESYSWDGKTASKL